MKLNRRHFFKAAGTAGLGVAALQLVPDVLALPRSTQTSAGNVVLTNASVIDSVSPEPLLKTTVVVRGGRIVRVGPAGPSATERQDSQVIDVAGAWLLPGLRAPIPLASPDD